MKDKPKPSRYMTDPEFRKRHNANVRRRHLERMATDPEYVARHREWSRIGTKKYNRKKWDTDPQHRKKMGIFREFHFMFKTLRRYALGLNEELIGCTMVQFMAHLESLFTPAMTWENYGTVWTIDHKKPTILFDLTTKSGKLACWHYTNLQPMLRGDNIRKGNKYST